MEPKEATKVLPPLVRIYQQLKTAEVGDSDFSVDVAPGRSDFGLLDGQNMCN